jgi:hypothetical protein
MDVVRGDLFFPSAVSVVKLLIILYWQVGWAHADMAPGMMLGQDENSWAFDGYNVSNIS